MQLAVKRVSRRLLLWTAALALAAGAAEAQELETAVRYLPLDQFFNSGGLPIVVNDVLIGAVGAGGMAPSAQWSDEICIHNALTKVIGPQPPLAPFLAPGAPAAPAR